MTLLTMRQAAAEVGYHYDTFRKKRVQLERELGFPRPFRARLYDAEAIRAWRLRRSDPRAAEPAKAAAAATPDFETARASAMAQLRNAPRAG